MGLRCAVTVLLIGVVSAEAGKIVSLTADTPWVVSPGESDAVAAVIGRPVRHLQPNNMRPDGKGCGSDIHCRNVGSFRQAQVRSEIRAN